MFVPSKYIRTYYYPGLLDWFISSYHESTYVHITPVYWIGSYARTIKVHTYILPRFIGLVHMFVPSKYIRTYYPGLLDWFKSSYHQSTDVHITPGYWIGSYFRTIKVHTYILPRFHSLYYAGLG